MVSTECLRRIGEAIRARTEGIAGNMDTETIRALRQDVAVVFIEAMQTSGCEHPQGDVFNGYCFRCGGSKNVEKAT